MRDEQQQLIDLRGQRPVADAEIPVQPADRDSPVVIRVPGGGDQSRLIHEPVNISRPKRDDDQREHDQGRRQDIAAERAGWFFGHNGGRCSVRAQAEGKMRR